MNKKTMWVLGGVATAAVVLASGLTFAAARAHGLGQAHHGMHWSNSQDEGRSYKSHGREHYGTSGAERYGTNRDRDEGDRGARGQGMSDHRMGRHVEGERHSDSRSGFGYGRSNDYGPRAGSGQPQAEQPRTEQPGTENPGAGQL